MFRGNCRKNTQFQDCVEKCRQFYVDSNLMSAASNRIIYLFVEFMDNK